jgi:hypothetical protein
LFDEMSCSRSDAIRSGLVFTFEFSERCAKAFRVQYGDAENTVTAWRAAGTTRQPGAAVVFDCAYGRVRECVVDDLHEFGVAGGKHQVLLSDENGVGGEGVLLP